MKRSACLIFNPAAGQNDPEQDLQEILGYLEGKIDLDIRFTSKEVNADRLAKEAISSGINLIIASGGDGTLSAAASVLMETNIPLGVISRGTANAFASALDIPDTIEAACQAILGGATRVVDAARCNGKPMILLAGIGYEAETIKRASRESKDRRGVLAYVMAGVQQLRELQPFEAEIETEDKVIRVTAAALTVANAAPPTSILAQGPAGIVVDDGLLDLTIVAPTNPTQAIAASYHLLQSALDETAAERDDIGYLRAKRLKINTNPPQQVVLDGEIIGTTPIEVECVEKALTLLVPETRSQEPSPPEKLEGLPGLQVEPKSP